MDAVVERVPVRVDVGDLVDAAVRDGVFDGVRERVTAGVLVRVPDGDGVCVRVPDGVPEDDRVAVGVKVDERVPVGLGVAVRVPV